MLNNRHITQAVQVGSVTIGGGNPVIVQSMTNTDTANIKATSKQIMELASAGSEIVRITINNEEAAKAVPYIKEQLVKNNYNVPIAGCFHYNGHDLLTKFPAMAESIDKYRINPGNVGFGKKRDKNFETIINAAICNNKAVRIGVNWGSLDQAVTKQLMDDNLKSAHPKTNEQIVHEALIYSVLRSAQQAENYGLPANKIIISCKVSKVQQLIKIYQDLATQSNYALHLGLTEAGIGVRGIAATSAALSILLNQGIGDTIRASLTPEVGENRRKEVRLCQEILQSLGLRNFNPEVSACPGCGRTTSTVFQKLAADIQQFLDSNMPVWKNKYKGVENLKVAVMGCIVNGPGESKHADIGISLPGTGETPAAPVFIDGVKKYTLRGEDIAEQFQQLVIEYIENKYAHNTCHS